MRPLAFFRRGQLMVLGGNSVFQSPEGFFGYFLMKESISSYPLKADDEIVLFIV